MVYFVVGEDSEIEKLEKVLNDILKNNCDNKDSWLYWILIVGICQAIDELHQFKMEDKYNKALIIFWDFLGELLQVTNHKIWELEIGTYYFKQVMLILKKFQYTLLEKDETKEYLKEWYKKIYKICENDFLTIHIDTYTLGERIIRDLIAHLFALTKVEKKLKIAPTLID